MLPDGEAEGDIYLQAIDIHYMHYYLYYIFLVELCINCINYLLKRMH